MMSQQKEVDTMQQPAATQLNFMMVDDDAVCQFIHRRVLELSGYCKSARSAWNGRAALELLNESVSGNAPLPDVILLDLDMPLMNGIAFLESFRNLDFNGKERISIALLTSSVCQRDKEHAAALGVKHYLSKPFTLEALRSVVDTLPLP